VRLRDADLMTADAGPILLDLASRVQALPFGPIMVATIRRGCLQLPLVLDADVELAGLLREDRRPEPAWTHQYDLGADAERLGKLRVLVSDPVAFAPIEPMLRNAVGLLGLGIAHRHAREWLETKVLERGEQLAAGMAAIERQEAENARLAEIVRHSVNPTYVMDMGYRLVWMNQPFLDTFGLTWAEAIGQRPSSLIYDGRDANYLVEEVRAALSDGGAYSGEVVNRDRYGRELIFALRIDRLRSAAGLHEGYVAIREDVTERRRAERALAESEARFRDLTETASDWFWETDAEHCFRSLTGDWPKPGDPGYQMSTRRRWDFAVGDLHGESWQRHFDDLENRRAFRDFRYALQWPDGEVRHVSVSGRPVLDAAGDFIGYRGTGRDITGEVQARGTVDRLIRALDAIEDLVALFDADERLVFANRLFKNLHSGLDSSLAPGTTMAQILQSFAERGIIEDPGRAIPERLAQFRNPRGPVDIRRFGRWFRAKDQKLGDGGTLLIATDVTNAKEGELELRRAVDAAEAANAAKSSFLARMSHELRTPLNAILGLSEMLILMEGRLAAAKRREYLGDIQQAGRILLSHIDDILNFTRIEAGGLTVHPRPTDLRRSVAEAMRLMRVVARAHAVRLETDLARDLPPALADPRSVRQILVNLLGNAVKFSPAGGVVRLAVSRAEDRLRMSVIDHGVGIPADQLERIFEPFHQVGDPSHASREGGTGLGLSIVKALVERNAGVVSVESELGLGTTISVWLPHTVPGA